MFRGLALLLAVSSVEAGGAPRTLELICHAQREDGVEITATLAKSVLRITRTDSGEKLHEAAVVETKTEGGGAQARTSYTLSDGSKLSFHYQFGAILQPLLSGYVNPECRVAAQAFEK